MPPRIAFGLATAALAVAIFALACAGPQPLPVVPTSLPTLIPATLPIEPTVAATTTVTATATANPQTPPGPASGGAALFNDNCSSCHYLTAETKVGPGLQGLFSSAALPNGQPVTVDSVRAWIRSGSDVMPAFGPDKIADGDLDVLVAYLQQATAADGKYVYIADWDGNVVRVYDARTLEKVAEITGIDSPTGIFNTSRRYETLGH